MTKTNDEHNTDRESMASVLMGGSTCSLWSDDF